MSNTLYELSESYMNVQNLIDEESPDADILNALTIIEGAIENKAGNIANLIKSLDAEAEMLKAEERRLSQRRKVRENAASNMKQYLQNAMEQMGMDKIKTAKWTFSIQNNPPAVQIINEEEIPGKFLTFIPERYEVNKKLISEALKAGEDVKGCELSRGRSLRIR